MGDIELINESVVDKYTEWVSEKFDFAFNGKTINTIPTFNKEELESFDWNIGCILGDSGSGKSTILHWLGDVFIPKYDFSKSVVSQFDKEPEEVVSLLQGVGLSSIPMYFNTPNHLSNGQRARLDIAMALSSKSNLILIDEFTSVVNRDCAMSMSYAINKYVRKNNIRIVVASCHYDIIDWLRPDWCFNLNKSSRDRDIERIIYDETYSAYSPIKEKYILSKEVKI